MAVKFRASKIVRFLRSKGHMVYTSVAWLATLVETMKKVSMPSYTAIAQFAVPILVITNLFTMS